MPSTALAQSAKAFAGSWVEDQAARTIGSLRSLTFRQAADGGLEELRGSYANPLAQPVRFDGRPYAIDASRNTIAWTQTDPTDFVYRRMSGTGPGLAGVWKPQSRRSDSADTLRVDEVAMRLRVFANEGRSSSTSHTLTFDGRAAQVDGPATISGTAVAGRTGQGPDATPQPSIVVYNKR